MSKMNKRKKVSFRSENLKIDWISLNLRNLKSLELVGEISMRLSKFGFNAIIVGYDNNQKENKLRFHEEWKWTVRFLSFNARGEKVSLDSENCLTTSVQFSGSNAQYLYRLLKRVKLTIETLFKDVTNAKITCSRFDICYARMTKDENAKIKSFLMDKIAKIQEKNKNRRSSFKENKTGLIATIGSRSSPNFFRIYKKTKENQIRFELEMKRKKIEVLTEEYLFKKRYAEFEDLVARHFYWYCYKQMVSENECNNYMDWLLDGLRKMRVESKKNVMLMPYLEKETISLSFREKKKVLYLLYFLLFIRRCENEIVIKEESLDDESYYICNFRISSLIKFMGSEKQYYPLSKIKLFLENLHQIDPIKKTFSDQSFQTLSVFPISKVEKHGKFWIARISILKELYYYRYTVQLPESFIGFPLMSVELQLFLVPLILMFVYLFRR